MSAIIDACTKELPAWVLSEFLEVDFVLETVNQLMERPGPPLQAQVLIHSGQGAHYTSVKFVQLVKDSQLRQSMSRRANCRDNAPPESFFGHMKDEIDLSGCTCFEQIRALHDFSYEKVEKICGCSKYAARDSVEAVRKIFLNFLKTTPRLTVQNGNKVRGNMLHDREGQAATAACPSRILRRSRWQLST